MQAVGPVVVGFALEMLDLRTVLRDKHVVGQRRIVGLQAGEFFAAIEGFGGRRQDFKDGFRVKDDVSVSVVMLKFAANDDDVRVEEQAL